MARWASLFCIPAVLAVVYGLLVWQDRVLLFDALNLFTPYFSLVADYARSGELLLWNPWSNCGSPDAAYVEMGSYCPLTIAVGWLTGGGLSGFVVYWLLVWGIGGMGMLVLGRYLGAPWWGALTVTLGFMFSGFYLGQAPHTSWLFSYSFLPVILWRLDKSLICGRYRYAFEAGALYGVSAMAGYPPVVLLNGLFLAAWTAGRMLFRSCCANEPDAGRAVAARHRQFAALCTVAVVGGVVLSPTYAAFFIDAAGYSERTGFLDRDIAVAQHALPVGALATTASPYLSLLKVTRADIWPDVWFGLCSVYVGSAIPFFAIVCLAARSRNRWHVYLAGLAAAALVLAVGDATPFRGWLYDICPPTRFFRHTAVFRIYYCFVLSILALYGTMHLHRNGGTSNWHAKRIGTAVGVVVVGAVLVHGLGVARAQPADGGLYLANVQVAWAWLVIPVLLALPSVSGSSRRNGQLVFAVFVCHALVDGGLSVVQYGRIMTAAPTAVGLAIPDHDPDLSCHVRRVQYPHGRHPFNLNLFDKTPTLQNYNTLNNRFHTRAGFGNAIWYNLDTNWSDEPILAAAVSGEPSRFWFAEEALECHVSDANFLAFVRRSRELNGVPLVVHNPDKVLRRSPAGEAGSRDNEEAAKIRTLPAARRIDVRMVEYRPSTLRFEIDCPHSGWLLVTDRWARGWEVTIDNVRTSPHGGNFLFRAVHLAAGRHQVVYRYRPWGHPWLLFMSYLMLAGVALSMFRCTVRMYRSRPSHVVC